MSTPITRVGISFNQGIPSWPIKLVCQARPGWLKAEDSFPLTLSAMFEQLKKKYNELKTIMVGTKSVSQLTTVGEFFAFHTLLAPHTER